MYVIPSTGNHLEMVLNVHKISVHMNGKYVFSLTKIKEHLKCIYTTQFTPKTLYGTLQGNAVRPGDFRIAVRNFRIMKHNETKLFAFFYC